MLNDISNDMKFEVLSFALLISFPATIPKIRERVGKSLMPLKCTFKFMEEIYLVLRRTLLEIFLNSNVFTLLFFINYHAIGSTNTVNMNQIRMFFLENPHLQ